MANRSGLNETGLRGRGSEIRQMPTRKRGEILLRFWRYLGRNRLLLALAVFLCLGSSTLSLVGPRLAGEAINAIAAGAGRINFDLVLNRVVTMAVTHTLSARHVLWAVPVMIHLPAGGLANEKGRI